MKRALILFLFFIACGLLPTDTPAQGEVRVRRARIVPAACDPNGITGPALIWKTSTTADTCGSRKGLCTCTATDTWTHADPTITGTANQVTVTTGVDNITISTPQDIATTSIPTFAGLLKTNVAAPATPTAGITAIWADSTDKNLKAKDDAGNVTVTVRPFDSTQTNVVSGISSTGGLIAIIAEVRLGSTGNVNMNTATATTLFSCPADRFCAITKVVVRSASTSLTTASYSFGWGSPAFNDVIADATHTELVGSTVYTVLPAKAGALIGSAEAVFKVLMNTPQGSAATTTIDVFGYIF